MSRPVVVLSDLHFGERFCTLAPADPSGSGKTGQALPLLLDYLAGLGRISELVLLGDIFEIWRFSWAQAQTAAAPFFEAVAGLPIDRITFTFGNHDHPLLFHYEYLDRFSRSPNGKDATCDPSFLFNEFITPFFNEHARSRVNWFYPIATREVGMQRLILHHGHYLQFLPLTPLLAKLTRHRSACNRWGVSEMERPWTYVFNSFRVRQWDRAERDRIHLWSERMRRGMASSIYAKALILAGAPLPKPVSWLPDVPAQSIDCYLEDAKRIIDAANVTLAVGDVRPIDRILFIFGHIHHSELWLAPEENGLSLLSLGSWVDEEGSAVQGLNSFAVIFDDRVELRRIDESAVRLLASVSL